MTRRSLPEGSLGARLDGDEFVMLLRDASPERIAGVGDLLRQQFHSTAAQALATPDAVTLSIGASLFDQPPASLAALIEQGDAALYQSKRGGRDSLRLVDRIANAAALTG
ncbi:diguanylate cyclase [Pseudomonas sp. D2-3]